MKIPSNPIRKSINNPRKVLSWIKNNVILPAYTASYLYFRQINQTIHSKYISAGDLDVMNEKWDILIILDACRYDYFNEINSVDGSLSKRNSPGSMSKEYIDQSFCGRELHDTVYVTANPFVSKIPEGTFYDIISHAGDFWENDIDTVPPERMIQATRTALDKYPNKRIISHFMQPHHPFLSDFGRKMNSNLHWQGSQFFPINCTSDDIRRAYRENIEYVLNKMESITEYTDRETVITSDHGELMGERLFPIPIKGWEHPKSLYVEELIEVPWLRIPGENRKIVSEQPKNHKSIDHETLNRRLKQLGYK